MGLVGVNESVSGSVGVYQILRYQVYAKVFSFPNSLDIATLFIMFITEVFKELGLLLTLAFFFITQQQIEKMNRTKLPIRKRLGNIPQFPVGADAVIAEYVVVGCLLRLSVIKGNGTRDKPDPRPRIWGCYTACARRSPIVSVNGEFEAKDDTMAKYLRVVKGILTRFDEWYTKHIPREENITDDALSQLASSEIKNYPRSIYFQVLKTPTIYVMNLIAPVGVISCWIDPIKTHSETRWLPKNAQECLRPLEAEEALKEAHEGICG
ncbi:hypothetical protein AgCh_032972 [Apium graveolens]